MKVEVDLGDLETIVFATAAIKSIENALQARKQDPFVKPHLAYAEAHDRLVGAMNGARRATADTKTAWDGDLTIQEVRILKKLWDVPLSVIGAEYRQKHPEIDKLLAKGCIRMGQCVEGALWAGETRADIRPTSLFAIAITQRGKEKFEQAIAKNPDLLDDNKS